MNEAKVVFVTIDDDGEPVEITTTRVDDRQICVCAAGEDGKDVARFLAWLSSGTDTGTAPRGALKTALAGFGAFTR